MADPVDHLRHAFLKPDLGLVSEQAPRLVSRAIGKQHLLRTAMGVIGLEVELRQAGDHVSQFIDRHHLVVGTDVDDFADACRVERHLLQWVDIVGHEAEAAHLVAIAIDIRLAPLEHQIDEDARDVAIRVVIFLARPDDVVRHRDDPFHAMRFGEIAEHQLGGVLADAIRVLRLGDHVLGERHLVGTIARHRGAHHEAADVAGDRGGNHRGRCADDILGDQVRREYRQAFISRRRAMIGDVDAGHVSLELIEVVAVELVEFDRLGDIVEVAADHIVVADHLMPVGQEGVGQVAAEEPGHARDEDTLLFHIERKPCAIDSTLPSEAGRPRRGQAFRITPLSPVRARTVPPPALAPPHPSPPRRRDGRAATSSAPPLRQHRPPERATLCALLR